MKNKLKSDLNLRQRADELFRSSAIIIPESTSPEEMKIICHELQVHQIELEMQNEELRRAQEELDVTQARYFDLYDLAPVGYLTLSSKRMIRECNLAASNMFNVPRSALINEPVSRILPKEEQIIFYRHLNQSIELGAPQEWQMRLVRDDGELFWAHLQVSSAQNGEYWITFNNITDKITAEQNLSHSKIAAEAANISKSTFLANMSHEIRTPMNGIIAISQLLQLTELTEEQMEYTELLNRSSKNLLKLISDILDLSKIEAGCVELETHNFDLSAEMKGTVDIYSMLAREKGLDVDFLINPDVPVLLIGDMDRLRQIVTNLIGNAIKFSTKGPISLHISKDKEDILHTTLRFQVRDCGIGIGQDKVENIFEAFTQADSTTGITYGGTGLGLAIARHLVELNGGNIGVESSEGKGSAFWFTVVLQKQIKPPYPRITEKVVAVSTAKPTNVRILLVEDDEANQVAFSRLLTKSSHRVDIAENGREALNLLAEKDFDIVLMDCRMPVMDGYEATEAIRDQNSAVKNHAIPIIALTANAMLEDRKKCLDAGMDDYISKPIDFPTVLALLGKWVNKHES